MLSVTIANGDSIAARGLLWGPDGRVLLYSDVSNRTRGNSTYIVSAVNFECTDKPQNLTWSSTSAPVTADASVYTKIGNAVVIVNDGIVNENLRRFSVPAPGIRYTEFNGVGILQDRLLGTKFVLDTPPSAPRATTIYETQHQLISHIAESFTAVRVQSVQLESIRRVFGDLIGKVCRDGKFYLFENRVSRSPNLQIFDETWKWVSRPLQNFTEQRVLDFDVSADGTRLALCFLTYGGHIACFRIYDISGSGMCLQIAEYDIPGYYVAYSADDSMLAVYGPVSRGDLVGEIVYLVDME